MFRKAFVIRRPMLAFESPTDRREADLFDDKAPEWNSFAGDIARSLNVGP